MFFIVYTERDSKIRLVAMRLVLLAFVTVALLIRDEVKAEIDPIIISWKAGECQTGCDVLLEREFRKLYGIEDLAVNIGSGQMSIRWKANQRFDYYAILSAIKKVGLHIANIRVKVRGMVRFEGANSVIISNGDKTLFYLLGPIQPEANRYTPTRSIYNRQLTFEQKAQLMAGEKSGSMAVIEGPLFEPYRSPPLFLIVENISFVKPAEEDDDKP